MSGAPFPGSFPPPGEGLTVEQQQWLTANIPPPDKPAHKIST